ncbi:primary-amine oxidase [Paenibacillus glycanilyticus]|uniref:Amine oxidase n=1 Tax=Paenibacillus glycanilyticus TaxID=126569 RepID=A0ABQ6GJL7_9BACL|nr:primary-amine oxidase [Paenibacillus glycanilyticus]GLX70285.1 amine oxidase [Paenibacillus glycanilyticus]
MKRQKTSLVKKTAAIGTALTVAFGSGGVAPLSAPTAEAHGGSEDFVPLRTTLEEFGATVKWDNFSGTITITKNSTIVKVKQNSNIALINGKRLEMEAPVIMKKNLAYVSHHFVSEVFQSGLDQTFQVEKKPNPLNPLTSEEIAETVTILKAAGKFGDNYRFTEITLKAPPKDQVWKFALDGTSVTANRSAAVVILDGKQVIEGTVDLVTKKVTAWQPIEGAHGMLLIDDFGTVQKAIEESPEYAAVLKKRGINDVKQVVSTPLTVGYFDGKDGLQQDKRLLKVVSYLNTGDGNYWAHPIENLVAVVDLEQKKVIKIEDAGVVPVPMKPTPYDGSNMTAATPSKPLEITEPEGKNYTITGNTIHWQNWDFHLRLDSRVGPILSTVTYNDQGKKRKIMYEGSLGGMIVPYGDPDVGWYFKAYLDSGEYGMGTLTSSLARGKDVPDNSVLLDATIADYTGAAYHIPNAMAIFERYAGPEYKHQEMGQDNVSAERRELVVRWISTVGNYDYIFDWVFAQNGTIGINAGATGIEAVKGVESSTMHDDTAADDTKYGTLIDHNIVGTTHQHIYNFRLDMDVDGEQNSLMEIDPVVADNTAGGPRESTMQTETRIVPTEQEAAQKFDASTIRLVTNTNKENKVGNPVSYQIIPYAGGTHPIAKGANFSEDEWLFNRVSFMDKQLWVTRYYENERYPEGKYPNRAMTDTGLGLFTSDNEPIVNTDNVVWMTTGTTHVARAEEWPIMPTEWVYTMLKPWNFFDQTPTLNLNGK